MVLSISTYMLFKLLFIIQKIDTITVKTIMEHRDDVASQVLVTFKALHDGGNGLASLQAIKEAKTLHGIR